MTAQAQGEWWDPASSAFDRDRARRLRDALMALIERDVAFSRDAMVQAYHYPEAVTLGIEIVEQDDASDEDPCDDWLFKLEGPAFKIVLIAVGRPGGAPRRSKRCDSSQRRTPAPTCSHG